MGEQDAPLIVDNDGIRGNSDIHAATLPVGVRAERMP
jgi:hypothetical protein